MHLPDRTRLLKIRLHDQGEDMESVWAEDLGAALLDSAARYVRICNIPALHAKPTYGDVIEVQPSADGTLEWDRRGVDSDAIGMRLLTDSGRWVAIIDYWPSRSNGDVRAAFTALDEAGRARDIVVEGMFTEGKRGCAYLAVPDEIEPPGLVSWLASLRADLCFVLRHPESGPE